MKSIKNICRILLALLFIYSGFVKGIDPLGSTYKFTDYFYAFQMNGLTGSALFFSFLLSLFEFTLGICLLLKLFIRWTSWGVILFMGILTPLTLILAIKNPINDCGCFGDALTLTNWETFWKNFILLGMSGILFYKRQTFQPFFNIIEQSIILLGSIIFMFYLELYCYRHLPILDFRPYYIGQNIKEGMTIPEDAPQDEYAITLKYKNRQTGEIKEFDEQNYPWQDTLHWEYVSSSEKLIKTGFKTPIQDFTIEHPTRGDITQEILDDPGYTFLVIAYDIRKIQSKHQEQLNQLATYAITKGYRFYGISASDEQDIQTYKESHQVQYDFCSMDETQLKTIIRSNPGLLLIREGTILNKWSCHDFPSVDELKQKDLTAYCLNQLQTQNGKQIIWILILGYALILSSYGYLKFKARSRRYH